MSRGIDDAGSLGMEDFFLFFLFCQAFVLVEFLLRDVTIEHVARGGFTWCSFDLDFFRFSGSILVGRMDEGDSFLFLPI